MALSAAIHTDAGGLSVICRLDPETVGMVVRVGEPSGWGYPRGMPYHVRITRRSNRSHDEVKLDLTAERLEEQFLRPYREGRPVVIGGMTIPSDDIERIRINETSDDSDQLLPQIRAERQASRVLVAIPDDWYVADRGEDVTDELITGPPGSARGLPDPDTNLPTAADPQAVFVVHGRNAAARDALFSFLRAIGLHPLEWAELVASTGSGTPYIGEVLDEAFRRAQAVVVLMTPDDEARLRDEFHEPGDPPHETDLTPQARPNVLFEAGMAVGRRPDRTVIVELGTVRPFSDIAGRHVVRLGNSGPRRQELAQRLQTAGCAVNLTGTDWHHSGNLDPPM